MFFPEDDQEIEAPAKIQIHDKMTMPQIAEALEAARQGYIELTEAERKQVAASLLRKPDGCARFEKKIKAVIEEHKAYIKKHQSYIKSITNEWENTKQHLVYSIRKAGLEDGVEGEEFEITLKETPGSIEANREPTEKDFKNYPGLVREEVSYSWDKKAIKEAFHNGTCPIPNDVVFLRTTVNPVFKMKKGIK
jgi:hypothetical protein